MCEQGIEEAVLRAVKKLGFSDLRPQQMTAIKTFMQGKDVFVTLPTGYGKSLIYSVLPYAYDELLGCEGSIIIVVSPLLSLMKDQVTALMARGLQATCITGEIRTDKGMQAKVMNGDFRAVFISPELLLTNTLWRQMVRVTVYAEHLVAFVVDEAHCVTQWGEYFRQEFGRLGEIRSLIPHHVNLLALTATATVSTRNKIIRILGMKDPAVIATSPDKPNVSFCVKERGTIEDTFGPLVEKLRVQRSEMQRVMIFCHKYEHCADLYDFFQSSLGPEFTDPIGASNRAKFRLADMYCSVTQKEVQESIIKSFSCSRAPLRVLICTIAFGMGLDCVDVTQIIHWGPASDLESYMQECGRAGRNGQPSSALLYVKRSDLRKTTISNDMIEYCTQSKGCRRALLCTYFDCSVSDVSGCACCDICAKFCVCSECKCTSFPMCLK